jgi:predicted transcriptional regulator
MLEDLTSHPLRLTLRKIRTDAKLSQPALCKGLAESHNIQTYISKVEGGMVPITQEVLDAYGLIADRLRRT